MRVYKSDLINYLLIVLFVFLGIMLGTITVVALFMRPRRALHHSTLPPYALSVCALSLCITVLVMLKRKRVLIIYVCLFFSCDF